MLAPNSYKRYRHTTRKIGWTLACLLHQRGEINPPGVTDLYDEQELFAAYKIEPAEIENGLCRNILERNLSLSHGNKYSQEIRFFQHEIEEVCRKTMYELQTIEKCIEFGISEEDILIENLSKWKEGKVFLSEEDLDFLFLSSYGRDKEEFLAMYSWLCYHLAMHNKFVRLPYKNRFRERIILTR